MLNLTSQCFVEVVVLGIFWEHWPPTSYRGGWTTIDHVLKILLGLDVVTKAQIKMVQHRTMGQVHQRKLYRHCGITSGSEHMTNIDSWFLCQGSQAISLPKLVRNRHLQLLNGGAEKAIQLEETYRETLSKESYLAEAAKTDARFQTSAASACASSIYRERVARELKEN